MVVELMKGLEVFSGLTPPELEMLAGLAREEVFRKGEALVREHEAISKFYIVRSGVAEIGRRSPTTGRFRCTARLEAGHGFGELALFDEIQSMVEVIASVTPETHVHAWHNFEVQKLLAAQPALAYKLARNILRRVAERMRSLADAFDWGPL